MDVVSPVPISLFHAAGVHGMKPRSANVQWCAGAQQPLPVFLRLVCRQIQFKTALTHIAKSIGAKCYIPRGQQSGCVVVDLFGLIRIITNRPQQPGRLGSHDTDDGSLAILADFTIKPRSALTQPKPIPAFADTGADDHEAICRQSSDGHIGFDAASFIEPLGLDNFVDDYIDIVGADML